VKFILFVSLTLLLASNVHAAVPGDSAEGKRLHDANCGGCHDTGVYTRDKRSVRTLDALAGQLESCGHMTRKELTATEKQNIIKYLNDRFYHFR
jgi:hypothetical protein